MEDTGFSTCREEALPPPEVSSMPVCHFGFPPKMIAEDVKPEKAFEAFVAS